jgi:polyhydroxyalkanoate synthase subunit PhaC
VQAYLATTRTADQLIEDAALGWRDGARVRFLAENVEEALAPSNLPLVNPASAKAAIGSRGLSLVRGGMSLLRDLAAPPQVPEMVDTSPFEVDRNIAVTPGAVVLRTEVLELIQYRPQTGRVREVPLLIVPPTIILSSSGHIAALVNPPGNPKARYQAGKGTAADPADWLKAAETVQGS